MSAEFSNLKNQIHIEGMSFYSYHGLLDEEIKIGGRFVVDIKITTDFSNAVANDDIQGTIDYSRVYDLVDIEMQIPSRLIEHLAGRIKKTLLKQVNGIQNVEVKVSKLRPPVKGVMEKVSVIV